MKTGMLPPEWNISPAAFFGLSGALALGWGLVLWFTQPHGGHMLALFVGGSVCLAASVVDWQSGLLPDVLTLGGGAATMAACALAAMSAHGFVTLPGALLPEGAAEPLLGAALGFAFLKGAQLVLRRKHRGVEQIGSGDAKLMLPLGAMTGPSGLLPLLLLACLSAFALFRLRRGDELPFGPALTAAGLAAAAFALRWP